MVDADQAVLCRTFVISFGMYPVWMGDPGVTEKSTALIRHRFEHVTLTTPGSIEELT